MAFFYLRSIFKASIAFVLCLSALFVSNSAFAKVAVGGALSSVTAGRVVPSLHAGLGIESVALSFYTTGVRTSYYYHSAYQLSLLWTWSPGKIGWGDVEAGIGFGSYYSEKGYREGRASDIHRHHDVVFGPVTRVAWSFAGPVFLSLETLFGVRGLHPLFLYFQDTTKLSLGVAI